MIRFHELELPIGRNGIPFITQPPTEPDTITNYDFTERNGSHMYHSHYSAAEQIETGLLGAFIVEPGEPGALEKVDVDELMPLNDGFCGDILTGKIFPATQPVAAKPGQNVRAQLMGDGVLLHPMHSYGMFGMVTALVVQ